MPTSTSSPKPAQEPGAKCLAIMITLLITIATRHSAAFPSGYGANADAGYLTKAPLQAGQKDKSHGWS